MINLKSKILATITIVLIISIALSSYGYAAASPKTTHEKPVLSQRNFHSFTLEVTGHAINSNHEKVDVSITIQGNTDGKVKTAIQIHTKGGDTTIENFETISVTKGNGIIVNKYHFTQLNLMMSATYYGGRSTIWILSGNTDSLSGNSLTVSLHAPIVVLPLKGYPHLTHLSLDGTIGFT